MSTLTRRTALAALAAAPAALALPGQATANTDANPFAAVGGGPRCDIQVINCDVWGPEYPKGSMVVIDPDRVPQDGDLVHVQYNFRIGKPFKDIVPFHARQGHDANGRFCQPGSPNEVVCTLAPIKYTRADMERGAAQILGTVCAVIAKL